MNYNDTRPWCKFDNKWTLTNCETTDYVLKWLEYETATWSDLIEPWVDETLCVTNRTYVWCLCFELLLIMIGQNWHLKWPSLTFIDLIWENSYWELLPDLLTIWRNWVHDMWLLTRYYRYDYELVWLGNDCFGDYRASELMGFIDNRLVLIMNPHYLEVYVISMTASVLIRSMIESVRTETDE